MSILEYLRGEYPLLSDPDLIKVAVGDFYKQSLLKKQQKWVNSLRVLPLTKPQTEQLDKDLTESVASGFVGAMDKEEFFATLGK